MTVEGQAADLKFRNVTQPQSSRVLPQLREKEWLPVLRKKLRSKFISNYPLAHMETTHASKETPTLLPEINISQKAVHKMTYKRDHLRLPIQTDYVYPLNDVIQQAPHDGFFWLMV
ncbi:uncharacterized protein LOC121390667 isoform X2 [Gigantopelta aegis]|nr:uncharacterized protein LOC121390667 isoform X2 [Gigantopelta aegis]